MENWYIPSAYKITYVFRPVNFKHCREKHGDFFRKYHGIPQDMKVHDMATFPQ